MSDHDPRVAAALTWSRRPPDDTSRTVENAPGPAEERRFGRRLAAVLVAVVLVVGGAVVGEHVLGHYRAVPVIGTWLLHEIDHDGRPTVTQGDLGSDQDGVPLEFHADGTFVMFGRCNPTGGDYDVSWDELTLSNEGSTLVGCAYTSAGAERQALLLSNGVGAVLDVGGATVSRPGADKLELSVDDGAYVLRYDREPG